MGTHLHERKLPWIISPTGYEQYGDLPDGNVGSDFAIKRRHFIGVTRWFDIAQLS
jgi:hypothetical protein